MITEYTGRMSPLTSWTQEGAILGLEGGSEIVEPIIDKVRAQRAIPYCRSSRIPCVPPSPFLRFAPPAQVLAAGVAVKAIWLQDWAGLHHAYDGDRLQWNWRLSSDSYPDWSELSKNMTKVGVKMMTYINPYFQKNLDDEVRGRDRSERASKKKKVVLLVLLLCGRSGQNREARAK
jgi:alpha-glucosidase